MIATTHNSQTRVAGCVAAIGLVVGFCLLWPALSRADNRDVFPPPLAWVSENEQDHPLVGKVWSRQANGLVAPQVLGTAIAKARFSLLGEVHDNPDHHLWQAWGIRNISKLRGARIVEGAPQIEVVAMEMVRADQIPTLDKFYGRNAQVPRPRGAKAFGRMLKWNKSGWSDYKIYQPIVEAALADQFVLVPASPSREESRSVSKKGIAALRPDDAKALALTTAFGAKTISAMEEELREGHCGLLPEKAISPMRRVQRFRDAIMADALMNVSAEKGGILIAGNGHIRRDRAVPWYLQARGVAPETIVSVAHIEVKKGNNDPSWYLPRDEDGKPAVDFAVFTPAPKREDMCEKMRAHMAAKSKAKSKKQPDSAKAADKAKQ
ncbi:MAG: ChaN family lipoprotein [Hyphomicrobiaceae bacterium]